MRGWWNEALPDNPATRYEAHERTGQVAAAVVVVEEKGREDEGWKRCLEWSGNHLTRFALIAELGLGLPDATGDFARIVLVLSRTDFGLFVTRWSG